MNIAILGWGSLIWDPRDLPHYGPWKTGGPTLPIEFSRVSSDGRLTLVIDSSGSQIPTRFALSPRVDISDAVEDIRRREDTIRKRVGFLIAATGANSRQEFAQQVDVNEIIGRWCVAQQIDACVWTALCSNFREELGVEFSPDQAVAYVEKLGKTARKKALKYIRNAPPEVDTPLRRKVSEKWPNPAS
jgi:hypothetical protein